MKNLNIKTAVLLGMMIFIAACNKNDDPIDEQIKLTVQAVAPTEKDKVAEGYEAFTVLVVSGRDGQKKEAKLNKTGEVSLVLDKGSYTITINGASGEQKFFGTLPVAEYGKSQSIKIEVKLVTDEYNASKQGLVIKEIFYNGGTYNGQMQHPDQYLVIANNSDNLIYVDGLVIAQTSNMNSLPCESLVGLMPNEIAVSNMYQIPGSGKEYALQPGEVYVIARLAINHTETLGKNPDKDTGIPVDLSGADFELADGDAYKWGEAENTVDNPEVPNLIKISNNLPGGVTGWMHPYAIRPIFIFDGAGIDWDKFREKNKITYKEKPNIKQDVTEFHGYKVSTKLIVDGIESTSAKTPFWGNFTTKSLPASVDKGFVQGTLEGCHHNTFMFRITENGKLKDTNDSSVDVKIEHRPNFEGYPKGWRNK